MPRCGRSTTRGARVWIESDVAPETMVVALRLETSRATTRAPRRARAASARARGVLFALILRVARVSGSGSALVGEACGVDADCYDGYGCAGVCCSSTSGYGITNCQTCGQDVASGGNFVCLQCKPGYERFQWSNGYRCRRVCEANEFLKYSSDWTCTAKYSAGAGCSLNNDDWCQSGKCGRDYCCNAAAVSAGCSTCSAYTGSCNTQAFIGEACSVDADCYDGYGCAGVCCSSTSGYGITNCQTCGQDVASGGNFVCLQCKPGYERFQWSNGYRCRRVCEANEFLKYSSDWTCTAKYSAGAGCSLNNDDWCQSGKCGRDYCCNAAAVSAGCSTCSAYTGSCNTQAFIGEACSVDADCYDGYGCAGVCCSSTSGYGITNCQTCGQDVASGGNFVCLQCKPGYERFQWSNGYRCRRVCEANEFLKYSSDWTCTAKYSAGAGCSLNNDDWCQSGKCGRDYCCNAAAVSAAWQTSGECCTLCGSYTGDCLTTGGGVYYHPNGSCPACSTGYDTCTSATDGTCSANYHVNNVNQCEACYVDDGSTNAAGDATSDGPSQCECPERHYWESTTSTCQSCEDGYSGCTSAEDGTCGANYRVNSIGRCEACPAQATNAAGDVTSGGETQCTCNAGHYPSGGLCPACSTGYAGCTSAEDGTCGANYRVNSIGRCEACPAQATNAAGDVTSGGETQCTCNAGRTLSNGECTESTEFEVKIEFAGITQVINDALVLQLQNALTRSLAGGSNGVTVNANTITMKYTMLGKQTFPSPVDESAFISAAASALGVATSDITNFSQSSARRRLFNNVITYQVVTTNQTTVNSAVSAASSPITVAGVTGSPSTPTTTISVQLGVSVPTSQASTVSSTLNDPAFSSHVSTAASNAGVSGISASVPPCTGLTQPTDGHMGTCSSELTSGSSCQPTCVDGYTVSGATFCVAGTLTMATCLRNSGSFFGSFVSVFSATAPMARAFRHVYLAACVLAAILAA